MADGATTIRHRQRMDGLKRAQEVRKERAEFKRQLRKGLIDPYLLLDGLLPEYDRIIGPMKLTQFLNAIPGIGPVAEEDIYAECDLLPTQTVQSLSPAKRREIGTIVRQIGI